MIPLELAHQDPLLHISAGHFVPSPAVSHSMFAAGFLFLGAVMFMESRDPAVWYFGAPRGLIVPSALLILGLGMMVVTVVEPTARLAHFAMGVPLAMGGVAEAGVRSGSVPRRLADAFIVPGLLFASLETGVYHLSGPPGSGIYLTHLGIVVAGVVVAGLRLYESRDSASTRRHLLISGAMLAIAADLFVDGYFQATG